MNCEVTAVEDIPGAPLSPPDFEFQSPFPLIDLFTSFTTGDFPNQIVADCLAIGLVFLPTLDVNLFTFTLTVFEEIIPVPSKTASIFIGNLAVLTAPIGTSNANGFRFGVDVTAINTAVLTYMAGVSAELASIYLPLDLNFKFEVLEVIWRLVERRPDGTQDINLNLRVDVTTRDDGTGRPTGQPLNFPFNIFDVITVFLNNPVQTVIIDLVSQFGSLFSFAPCPPAQITVEQVQYPFAEEELKLDLGNLFTIRSPFNERNTRVCYFFGFIIMIFVRSQRFQCVYLDG